MCEFLAGCSSYGGFPLSSQQHQPPLSPPPRPHPPPHRPRLHPHHQGSASRQQVRRNRAGRVRTVLSEKQVKKGRRGGGKTKQKNSTEVATTSWVKVGFEHFCKVKKKKIRWKFVGATTYYW